MYSSTLYSSLVVLGYLLVLKVSITIMQYYHNLIPCPAGKALRLMTFGNITSIPKPMPRATSGLTFKEVALQPEFEAYELAVTPPGVAS